MNILQIYVKVIINLLMNVVPLISQAREGSQTINLNYINEKNQQNTHYLAAIILHYVSVL